MNAGTSGTGVDVEEGVALAVWEAVGLGVAVGGKTICVTKLHASKKNIKIPNAIRLTFIKKHGVAPPLPVAGRENASPR